MFFKIIKMFLKLRFGPEIICRSPTTFDHTGKGVSSGGRPRSGDARKLGDSGGGSGSGKLLIRKVSCLAGLLLPLLHFWPWLGERRRY